MWRSVLRSRDVTVTLQLSTISASDLAVYVAHEVGYISKHHGGGWAGIALLV
jgi:hypothetical protein